MNLKNPIGICGISFVEFASPKPKELEHLFLEFGFSKVMTHAQKKIDLFQQNEIIFLLNYEAETFAAGFSKVHGPSICSMGWKVQSPVYALEGALARGAKRAYGDYLLNAIFGIGESLIYFTPQKSDLHFYESIGFKMLSQPVLVPSRGFTAIDHLTNNVPYGTMKDWGNFYKNLFGFTEVRYFDIRGAATGLTSYALKSPDGSFCIPINEATERESQINEYLREYNGPGIQHLAFLTDDIIKSLEALKETSIQTLDMDEEYYQEAFVRVPQVTENKTKIKNLNILVDGDQEGYLLQIFTKNLIGPIFIEIIQRKNHYSFGEGNFKALFRSIERDQIKRGVVQLKKTNDSV